MDDLTVGRVLRALRRRRGLRQRDVAEAAGRSQTQVWRAESGRIDGRTVGTIRRLFRAVDAAVKIAPSWRGAELQRLLDADHARLTGLMADRLERELWQPHLEVTYSEYGERGSIDILGLRPELRVALVTEIKSDVPSVEATGRKLDEKARLVPSIVERRFGWRPATVGRLLVLPDTGRLRRLVAATPALRRLFPDPPGVTRRWLRAPSGPLAGILFLPETRSVSARAAARRVRRPRRAE
jgi:transcriptional regulator with XRE-family HTH domain